MPGGDAVEAKGAQRPRGASTPNPIRHPDWQVPKALAALKGVVPGFEKARGVAVEVRVAPQA